MTFKYITKKVKWPKLLLGIVLGAIAGYAYYYYIGCQSGICPIQSDPVKMTLYGMFFGGVLFFDKRKNQPESDSEAD
ncbi:MAG: hypothetical protein JXR60_10825 [Bacteroidales bacterium]|nr:hypothetical protein [Bacteroidales bacterium]